MMTQPPLFSIITVTYNAADTVGVTVESVRSQTFNDLEHLIIDGASADNTIQIARNTGDQRLVIHSEADKGLYDAMNKGLSMARGQYVLFLNAGDTFHSPESLNHYAEGAQQDADIIYADTVLVDAEGNIIGPRHLSAPKVLTRSSFSHGMLICHQAFMVRRSLAPKYNLDYRFSADYDWTIRCIERTVPRKCFNLESVEINYLAEGITTANHHASLLERFNIMRHYYGTSLTLWRHIGFLGRAASRKLK
ncbi:MAG: glycosyltransferase [Muribaculaceae bacterium]|nr:glycosyltransferase [Muribaculaceae bacterium]